MSKSYCSNKWWHFPLFSHIFSIKIDLCDRNLFPLTFPAFTSHPLTLTMYLVPLLIEVSKCFSTETSCSCALYVSLKVQTHTCGVLLNGVFLKWLCYFFFLTTDYMCAFFLSQFLSPACSCWLTTAEKPSTKVHTVCLTLQRGGIVF